VLHGGSFSEVTVARGVGGSQTLSWHSEVTVASGVEESDVVAQRSDAVYSEVDF
jgi:hypothetical protein